MTPVLEAQNLHKSYRTGGTVVRAVAGLSFRLKAGGSIGLVGESGSGKSTTARMLVGLERPDSGEILVDGAPLNLGRRGRGARLAHAKAVQIVFQDPYLSLDPRMSAGSAIDAILRLHTDLDGAARKSRTAELLAQVGLGEREARSLPRQLSGGQRQRVAIARALAVEPRVLVLDEAVSALDVSVQAQVLNLLLEIRSETGVALVFVSHDLAVVRYVCDQALVLRNGKVAERGTTTAITCAPQDPYTRLLLASVPQPGWDLTKIGAVRKEFIEASHPVDDA